MKIFSNFDTKFIQTTYNQYCSHFGEGSVLLVKKGRRYLFFKVIIPFGINTTIYGGMMFLAWFIFGRNQTTIIIITISGLVYFLFLLLPLNSYIAYKMDAMIIAPENIIRIDQQGFFHRENIVINTNTIKSIRIEKDGLLRSIADFGTIHIHAGEGEEDTMIWMRYVTNPEHVRDFLSAKKELKL